MNEIKPLPCAYCGIPPKRHPSYREDYYFCGNDKCGLPEAFSILLLSRWNEVQLALMTQRRKDYVSGWNQGYCKGNNFDSGIDINDDFYDYIKKEQHNDSLLPHVENLPYPPKIQLLTDKKDNDDK